MNIWFAVTVTVGVLGAVVAFFGHVLDEEALGIPGCLALILAGLSLLAWGVVVMWKLVLA